MAVSTCTHTPSAIRNLALVGHALSGKTSLAEALLTHLGVLGQPGRVENQDTLSDFTPEEKHHGHSLYSTVLQADTPAPGSPLPKPSGSNTHPPCHINLIDTPGTPDFTGQALMVLPAVETVAVVINAANGIEPMTRRMMDKAAKRNLPRMIIVNKIDKAASTGADLQTLVNDLRETFGTRCLPINLPAQNATQVLDCFFHEDGQSDLGPVADAHTAIIEQCIEVDEDLMETYLSEGSVTPEQLHDAFEKALRESHLIPICFTASTPHADEPVGIAELTQIIERLLPSPEEGNPRPFIKGKDAAHEIHAKPDSEAHVLAHVFHVTIDPFVGKLCAMRVHQGTITPNTELYLGDPKIGESKRPFRVGHLYKLQGKQHIEIDKAVPGDWVAVAKVDSVHYDCVLHDSHDEDTLHLRPLHFPEPLFGLAITTPNRGDEQKLSDALTKLREEDPTLSVTHDPRTNETVIHGLGDLHLKIMLERLKEQHHVYVEAHEPKISYRETIQGKAEGHHRHKKQTGGAGQFGEVKLRIEPLPRGEGFAFIDKTVGGSIPKNFMPAIEKGVEQAMETGILAGYSVQDVRVNVLDGKYHPVDSKEVAFIEAGKKAFIEAFRKARPVVLEPMIEADITIPSGCMGSITSDLTSKRGRIMDTGMQGDTALIKAVAPLAEMSRYAQELKSLTAGHGTYTMQTAGYEPAPGDVQSRVMASATQTHGN